MVTIEDHLLLCVGEPVLLVESVSVRYRPFEPDLAKASVGNTLTTYLCSKRPGPPRAFFHTIIVNIDHQQKTISMDPGSPAHNEFKGGTRQ